MIITRTIVAYILTVVIGVTAFVVLAVEVLKGEPINPLILTLVSFITGFISSTIGNSQGALTALSIPAGYQLVPIQQQAKVATDAVHAETVGEGAS